MTRYRLLLCVKFSSAKHLQEENCNGKIENYASGSKSGLINFFTTVNPVYVISDFHFGMSFVPSYCTRMIKSSG